jgi:FlaG/FlaF family flagellin (archaellin)
VNKYLLSAALFLLAIVVLPAAAVGASVGGDAPSVSGKWQLSWQARLGTEQATVELEQKGTKLRGTFHDLHHSCQLSGTIDGANISFDVLFDEARPYTIAFRGTVDGDSITGTSQAQNIGGSKAYLGHGGEIVQPEHPWTATRPADPATLRTEKTKAGTTRTSN